MSVRMKLSHSKTASRRAHHGANVPRLVATPTGVRRRHFADPATGMYRGKQIIVVGSTNEVRKPEKKSSRTHKKEKETKAEK